MDIPLAFEPLSQAHLDLAAALWSDPAVTRYTAVGRPLTREEAAERLDQLLETQRKLPFPTLFAVMYRGERCGMVGCPPVDPQNGVFGLFYQIRQADWGKGVGGSAARWMCSYMAQKCGRLTLLADAAEENEASVRILKALGFVGTDQPGDGGALRYRWTAGMD